MEIYVAVSFVINIIALIINILILSIEEFPMIIKRTIGLHVSVIIFGVIFVCWSGLLLVLN